MASPLTDDTLDVIINSQRGGFIAATICSNIKKGSQYQLPDGKSITATTPSALIQELQTWKDGQALSDISNDYNQVRAFFEPQIIYASKSTKQKLLMDLLDYALELSTQL